MKNYYVIFILKNINYNGSVQNSADKEICINNPYFHNILK